MPLSARIRQQCKDLLDGDDLHYVFPAACYGVGAAMAPILIPVIVAVTARQVVVLRCSRWRRNQPKEVLRRYPRAIRLGPVDTSMTPEFSIGEMLLELDEEYVSVIGAADAEITEDDILPPDPFS